MPTIVSVQTGRIQRYEVTLATDRKPLVWQTAFHKTPVAGGVQVTSLGLFGDEQADRENHGGLDKALLAYSADHYPGWAPVLNEQPLGFGAFGENLTIAGLDETTVCIGDRWQAAEVVLEVSQPRQPCWKMGRRWNLPTLPKQVIQNGKSGWYFRVVTEGVVAGGLPLELLARPHSPWTVQRANRLFFHEHENIADLKALANLAPLSAAWREAILERLASQS